MKKLPQQKFKIIGGKPYLRGISLCLSLVFSLESAIWAAPDRGAGLLLAAAPSSINSLYQVDIPEALGTIQSRYIPETPVSGKPFIIHIQDAHAQPEAQKNIQAILDYLARDKKIEKVAAEAAFGNINLQNFKFSSLPEANRTVVNRLVEMGELTGAELFGMGRPGDVRLYGVEDESFYVESFQAFREVKSRKKEMEDILGIYGKELEQVEARIFSKDMLKWAQKKNAWDEHQDEGLEYFRVLRELSDRYLKIDLSNSDNQFDWPNLTRLLKAEETEIYFNRETASAQALELVEALKKMENSKKRTYLIEGIQRLNDSTLPFASWLSANTDFPEIKSTRRFFEFLYGEAVRLKISLMNAPDFLTLGGLLILREEIESAGLLKEIRILETRLENALVSSGQEKKLVQLLKDFSILRKLASLQLSREDYEIYTGRKQELTAEVFRKRVLEFKKIDPARHSESRRDEESRKILRFTQDDEELAKIAALCEKFYELSRKRDQILIENTLKNAPRDKTTVLIAGGFHSEGLSSLLKAQKIPHMVITPKIIRLAGDQLYEQVMMGENGESKGLSAGEDKLGRLFLTLLLREPEYRARLGFKEEALKAVLQKAAAGLPDREEILRQFFALPAVTQPAVTSPAVIDTPVPQAKSEVRMTPEQAQMTALFLFGSAVAAGAVLRHLWNKNRPVNIEKTFNRDEQAQTAEFYDVSISAAPVAGDVDNPEMVIIEGPEADADQAATAIQFLYPRYQPVGKTPSNNRGDFQIILSRVGRSEARQELRTVAVTESLDSARSEAQSAEGIAVQGYGALGRSEARAFDLEVFENALVSAMESGHQDLPVFLKGIAQNQWQINPGTPANDPEIITLGFTARRVNEDLDGEKKKAQLQKLGEELQNFPQLGIQRAIASYSIDELNGQISFLLTLSRRSEARQELRTVAVTESLDSVRSEARSAEGIAVQGDGTLGRSEMRMNDITNLFFLPATISDQDFRKAVQAAFPQSSTFKITHTGPSVLVQAPDEAMPNSPIPLFAAFVVNGAFGIGTMTILQGNKNQQIGVEVVPATLARFGLPLGEKKDLLNVSVQSGNLAARQKRIVEIVLDEAKAPQFIKVFREVENFINGQSTASMTAAWDQKGDFEIALPWSIFNFRFQARSEARVAGGQPAARDALIEKLEPYLEILSEGYSFRQGEPDVYVLFGNPDLKTFLRFSDSYKEKEKLEQRKVPIVLAGGGEGRGKAPLIDDVLAFYAGRLTPEETEALRQGKTRPDYHETDILRLVLLKEGVQTDIRDEIKNTVDGKRIGSNNTMANFERTKPVLQELVAGKEKPVIAVVTWPHLLARLGATALQSAAWGDEVAKENGWRVEKFRSYTLDLKEMTPQQLLDLTIYVARYPKTEDLLRINPALDPTKYPSYELQNELKGYYDMLPAGHPGKDYAHMPRVAEIHEALRGFMTAYNVQWNSSENKLVIPALAPQALSPEQARLLDEVEQVYGLSRADKIYLKGMWMQQLARMQKIEDPNKKALRIAENRADRKENENFILGSHLNTEEREKLLGAFEYLRLISGGHAEAAKNIILTANSMDGGIGESLARALWLGQRLASQGVSAGQVTLGAKGTDLGFDIEINGKKDFVSIAEAKIMQLIKTAEAKKYSGIQFQPLVNYQSVKSYEKLLASSYLYDRLKGVENPRTIRQVMEENGIEILPLLQQADLPRISLETGNITLDKENVKRQPGGHGQWGVLFMYESFRADIPDDGKTRIRAFYNGDNLNSSANEYITGWMAQNRIPIVKLTTAATPIDKKGGKDGVRIIITETGAELYVPDQMEVADAKSAGQQAFFEAAGQEGGNGEAGKQPFNTNVIYINDSVLSPILKDLEKAVGEDPFAAVISPTLIDQTPKAIEVNGEKFIPVDGAIGTVIHNLNSYFMIHKDEPAIRQILKKHNLSPDGRLLYFVDVPRTEFFTPVKVATDMWLQAYSDYYKFNPDTMRLEDSRAGLTPPEFDLVSKGADGKDDKFWLEVQNLVDSFGRASTVDLKSLTVEGKISLKDAKLAGDVKIINQTGKAMDLNDPALREKLDPVFKDDRLTLADVEIILKAGGEIVISSVVPEMEVTTPAGVVKESLIPKTTSPVEQRVNLGGVPFRRYIASPEAPVVLIPEAVDERTLELLRGSGKVSYDVLDPGPEGKRLTNEELIHVGAAKNQEGKGYFSILGFVNHQVGKSEEFFKAFPDLKAVNLFSRGFNQVDLENAANHNLQVTNIGDMLTQAMAELNLGMMVEAHYDLLKTVREESGSGRFLKLLEKAVKGLLAILYDIFQIEELRPERFVLPGGKASLEALNLNPDSMAEILWGQLLRKTLKLEEMYRFGRSDRFNGAGVAPMDTVLHDQLAKHDYAGIHPAIGFVADSGENAVLERLARIGRAHEVAQMFYYVPEAERLPEARERELNLRYTSSLQELQKQSQYLIRLPGAPEMKIRKENWIDPSLLFAKPSAKAVLNQPLKGKILGIQSYGAISRAVAKRALGLGLEVKVLVRTLPKEETPGVEFFDYKTMNRLTEFLKQVQILTLLAPENDASRDFISADILDRLSSLETLINTGRGGLLNENALAQYMEKNPDKIRVRLDVLKKESEFYKQELSRFSEVEVSGHTGSAVRDIRFAMQRSAVENLIMILEGRTPQNPVPLPVSAPPAAASKIEEKAIPVSMTNLSREEEVVALDSFLQELQRELAVPGSGKVPDVSFISDQHGAIEKFGALIMASIRKALPGRLPKDFKLNRNQSLSGQLLIAGIRLEELKGKIYFGNIGDLMDRGPFGIKVYRWTRELIEAGLSNFIPGNHDQYVMLNLWGVHLPWYDQFEFYGYTDEYDAEHGNVADLLKKHQQMEKDPWRQKIYWAQRLYEYNTFYKDLVKQTDWKTIDLEFNGELDDKGKRKKDSGLYDQLLKEGKPSAQQKAAWDKFRGWYEKGGIEVSTGLRDIGGMSVKWWKELAAEFKNAYPDEQARPDAVRRALAVMEEGENGIIPVLQTSLERQLYEGKWWWRIFQAIDSRPYESIEWLAKDWAYHKDWGTAVIEELNDESQKSEEVRARLAATPADKMTEVRKELQKAGKYKIVYDQGNYLTSPVLQEIADFYQERFQLHDRDIYQNDSLHAWLPVDDQGRFYFTFNNVNYAGKGDGKNQPSVWEGLAKMAETVKSAAFSFEDFHEIHEAISLLGLWYGDNTTEAKVPDVAKAIRIHGAAKLSEMNGFNRLFSGHLPFHEFSKLKPEDRAAILGAIVDGRLVFTDHGMGIRFGSRGAVVIVSPDGIEVLGYEHSAHDEIISNPRTVTIESNGAEKVLFENKGIPRGIFFPQLIEEVKARLVALRSEAQGGPGERSVPGLDASQPASGDDGLEKILEWIKGQGLEEISGVRYDILKQYTASPFSDLTDAEIQEGKRIRIFSRPELISAAEEDRSARAFLIDFKKSVLSVISIDNNRTLDATPRGPYKVPANDNIRKNEKGNLQFLDYEAAQIVEIRVGFDAETRAMSAPEQLGMDENDPETKRVLVPYADFFREFKKYADSYELEKRKILYAALKEIIRQAGFENKEAFAGQFLKSRAFDPLEDKKQAYYFKALKSLLAEGVKFDESLVLDKINQFFWKRFSVDDETAITALEVTPILGLIPDERAYQMLVDIHAWGIIQSGAVEALRMHGGTMWLASKIMDNRTSERLRKEWADLLDLIYATQPVPGDFLQKFAGEKNGEQFVKMMLPYRPRPSWLVKSSFFYPEGIPEREKLFEARMMEWEALKNIVSEEVFQKLVGEWGLDFVSHLAGQKNLAQKKQLITEMTQSYPVDAIRSMSHAQHFFRYLVESGQYEKLKEVLSLTIIANPQAITLQIADLIRDDSAKYSMLAAFLIDSLSLSPVVFTEAESSDVRAVISALLKGANPETYYLVTKLSEKIPHPGYSSDPVFIREPSRYLDESLTSDEKEKNPLFTYLRLKIHGSPDSRDFDMVGKVVAVLLGLSDPDPDRRLKTGSVRPLIQPFILAGYLDDVEKGLKDHFSLEVGKMLWRVKGDAEQVQAEHFLDREYNWNDPEKVKGFTPEQNKAWNYAAKLIELYRALQSRYQSAFTKDQAVRFSHSGSLEALRRIQASRVHNKGEIFDDYESYLPAEKWDYQKNHLAEGTEERWGFGTIGSWKFYQEHRYDAYEINRALGALQENIFDRFLADEFEKMEKELFSISYDTLPGDNLLPPEAARIVSTMAEMVSLLVGKMEVDGLASRRLVLLSSWLQRESLTLEQTENLLALIEREAVRSYHFYNSTFGDFAEGLALAFGKERLQERYSRVGNGIPEDARWARQVKDLLLTDLKAGDRSLGLLEQYTQKIRTVMNELKAHRKLLIRPETVSDRLITAENFDPLQHSAVTMGFKAFGEFSALREGLPVPPLVTLTAALPKDFHLEEASGANALKNPGFRKIIIEAILQLEAETGRFFYFDPAMMSAQENKLIRDFRASRGIDPEKAEPLFFSVRSGSIYSMPGLMDTVLNIPFNGKIVDDLIANRNYPPSFVYDIARRFIDSYGRTYYGISPRRFSRIVDHMKDELAEKRGMLGKDLKIADFTTEELKEIYARFTLLVKAKLKKERIESIEALEDPFLQVLKTVNHVYNSWNSEGARKFRQRFGISDDFGTSVTLQQMIFGNSGLESGTAVIFTEDYAAVKGQKPGGVAKLDSQDDLVSGRSRHYMSFSYEEGRASLEKTAPALYQKIIRTIIEPLQKRYPGTGWDLEVTWDMNIRDEDGLPRVYLLQRRSRIMARTENQKKLVFPPALTNEQIEKMTLSRGEGVSPNAAVGRILDGTLSFDKLQEVVQSLRKEMNDAGEKDLDIILMFPDYVTNDDSPKFLIPEVRGLIGTGGEGTHPMGVAEEAGLAYVSRVANLEFNKNESTFKFGDKTYGYGMKGPVVAIDGYSPQESPTSGHIFLGRVDTKGGKVSPVFELPRFRYDAKVNPLLVREPVKTAINLGHYLWDKTKGERSGILASNFPEKEKIAVNTVQNRIFDAYLREMTGNPNISLTDIYGVEDIRRFFVAIQGQLHGRSRSTVELKEKEGQAFLVINGNGTEKEHRIRIHEKAASVEDLKTAGTKYLIDFSDPELTGELAVKNQTGRDLREERLRALQQEGGLLKVFSIGDEDPAEQMIFPGINSEEALRNQERYFPLASPVSLAKGYLKQVVDEKFPGQFDLVAGFLAAKPVTGDSGNIRFLPGKRGGASTVEFDIEKGAGSAFITLIPKANSPFQGIAKQMYAGLKAIKDKKGPSSKEKEKESEKFKKKFIYENFNQLIETAAKGPLGRYLRYAGEENLNSLTAMRERFPIVFDSQATLIREDGQVDLYFYFTDNGYAFSLNQLTNETVQGDGLPVEAKELRSFQNNLARNVWPAGTIPPNQTLQIPKVVKTGDEIKYGIVGVRGRIGAELHRQLLEDPNFLPVFYLGVEDIHTLEQQFKEDVAQGPREVERPEGFYILEPLAKEGKIRMKEKTTGQYLPDPRTGEPLTIPYFHIRQGSGEPDDVFAQRMSETLGPLIDEVEVLINASGFAMDGKDKYYDPFIGGKNLKLVWFTAPAKGDADITVVRGVNEDDLAKKVESAANTLFCSGASCTTTGLGRALVEYVKFLESRDVEVEFVRFITHHGITPSQGAPHGDPSAGKSLRSASGPIKAANLEATGADKVIKEVVKELKGRAGGVSHRDGNFGGSVLDISATLRTKTGKYPTAAEINEHFEKLAKLPEFKGVMTYVPFLLSTAQITGEKTAAVFSADGTRIETGPESAVVTIRVGYDNEGGYTASQVHMIKLAGLKFRGLATPENIRIATAGEPAYFEKFLTFNASLGERLKKYAAYTDSDLGLDPENFIAYEEALRVLSRLVLSLRFAEQTSLVLMVLAQAADVIETLGTENNTLLRDIESDLRNSYAEMSDVITELDRSEARVVSSRPDTGPGPGQQARSEVRVQPKLPPVTLEVVVTVPKGETFEEALRKQLGFEKPFEHVLEDKAVFDRGAEHGGTMNLEHFHNYAKSKMTFDSQLELSYNLLPEQIPAQLAPEAAAQILNQFEFISVVKKDKTLQPAMPLGSVLHFAAPVGEGISRLLVFMGEDKREFEVSAGKTEMHAAIILRSPFQSQAEIVIRKSDSTRGTGFIDRVKADQVQILSLGPTGEPVKKTLEVEPSSTVQKNIVVPLLEALAGDILRARDEMAAFLNQRFKKQFSSEQINTFLAGETPSLRVRLAFIENDEALDGGKIPRFEFTDKSGKAITQILTPEREKLFNLLRDEMVKDLELMDALGNYLPEKIQAVNQTLVINQKLLEMFRKAADVEHLKSEVRTLPGTGIRNETGFRESESRVRENLVSQGRSLEALKFVVLAVAFGFVPVDLVNASALFTAYFALEFGHPEEKARMAESEMTVETNAMVSRVQQLEAERAGSQASAGIFERRLVVLTAYKGRFPDLSADDLKAMLPAGGTIVLADSSPEKILRNHYEAMITKLRESTSKNGIHIELKMEQAHYAEPTAEGLEMTASRYKNHIPVFVLPQGYEGLLGQLQGIAGDAMVLTPARSKNARYALSWLIGHSTAAWLRKQPVEGLEVSSRDDNSAITMHVVRESLFAARALEFAARRLLESAA